MLAALGQGWMTEMRRQKDMELVFRAQQITQAIRSYYDATPAGARVPPTSLNQLLEDRRGTVLRRHLRQLWVDPITGTPEWGLIKTGPYIRGVFSLSPLKPVRGDPSFHSYADWRFMAPVSIPAAPAAPAASAASAASAVADEMSQQQP